MKTTTITLYEFSELAPDVQKKVLEKLSDINTEGDYWNDGVLEDAVVELETLGYNSPDIHYSGFWSQGDGASFDATPDAQKIISRIGGEFMPLIRLAEMEELEINICKNGYANHYSHEKTRYIEVINNGNGETEWTKEQNDLAAKLEKVVEAERLQLSKDIYKRLQKQYEAETSNEAIIETIELNGYTFEVDGTMRNI
jgi:hypothetical protein